MKVKAKSEGAKKKDLECSERLMDTGFKKFDVDIVNLKQSQRLSRLMIQAFETNLKLERLIDTGFDRNSKVKPRL